MSAKAATKNTLTVTLAVAIAAILWTTIFHSDWIVAGIPKVSAAAPAESDKFDGECTGQETAGRCADKCPADTDQGVYYEQGQDRDGKLVCGFAYFHQCPYTNAVSADDPLCYKIQQEQQQTAADIAQTQAEIEANPAAFQGK